MMKFKIIVIGILLAGLSGCGLLPHTYTQSETDVLVAFYGQNNLEYAKELIDEGKVDVNKKVPFGEIIKNECSPLYLSMCESTDIRFLELLLENGADPDIAYGDKTPLMCELGGGNQGAFYDIDTIKVLLKYGADLSVEDNAAMTALDYAVSDRIDRPFPIIRLLLENGAKVSNKTLNLVARGGKDEICGELYYKSARLVFAKAKEQGLVYEDKLFSAVVMGESEEALNLLKKSKEYANNIPFYAAAFCSPDVIENLVGQGFDIKSADDDSHDLLQIAASAGNLDMVKYLVDSGVSMDFSSYDYLDNDPLKAAIIYDYYDVAKYLLESGATFNINSEVGYDGDKPVSDRPLDSLQGAIKNENTKMLKLMWKYGYPDDDKTDARALESAVKFDKPDMLEYFLKKGANPNPGGKLLTSSDSILDVCSLWGKITSLHVLSDYGTSMDISDTDALGDAAGRGKADMVEYLLNNGMPVDAFYTFGDGSQGDTAWKQVSLYGYFDIIKLLVEHGADVNDPDVAYIVKNGGESYNILKYLIDNGGDVNQKNEDGNTALMMAAQNGRVKNAGLLLKSGADKSIKNAEGKTARDIAKDSGADDIAKLLSGN